MEDAKISRASMVAITIMRILIGWHFAYEGIAKLTSASWSASGYLRQSRGPLSQLFKWLAAQPTLLGYADQITMYGLIIVGVLLVLGLFTRLASLAGIGFVLLFYVCNPPLVGYFYSLPQEGSYLIVNKQLTEIGGLLVVLVSGSGKFAGLDVFVHSLFARGPRKAPAVPAGPAA
jgi:thiosulfate dehydrogenase (quinone) large subunit